MYYDVVFEVNHDQTMFFVVQEDDDVLSELIFDQTIYLRCPTWTTKSSPRLDAIFHVDYKKHRLVMIDLEDSVVV